jgi:HlyD family secretion protein
VLAAAGCRRAPEPDAHGNVEATTIVVSAEVSGRVLALEADEGTTLTAGAIVGSIDVTDLTIQRRQLAAQHQATAARSQELAERMAGLEAQRSALTAQKAALESQREIAQRVYARTERLVRDQAATAQQLDQAERDARVLADQLRAQDDQIAAAGRQIAAVRAERETLRSQVSAAEAQVAQVSERIGRADVRNPSGGTVLVSYAKRGEFVQAGQPLYRIADLHEVDVRAYVTEPQLSDLRLGQDAVLMVDAAAMRNTSGLARVSGKVVWISSEAEFTPTPIQTRDERADLVYAVKIRAANPDGTLKIGMPVDVHFDTAAGRR